MSAIGRQITDLENESQKLKALVSDLTYNGIDRGYTRGSQMWVDAVRRSARECGLSHQDTATLVGDATTAD
jgi:hypothetical protein